MEVKIFCNCGSKYKFDVEPLNGKLPGPVSCPVCGADGTQKGNEILAQALGISATPITPVVPAVAPVVVAAQNESGPRIAIPSMPKPAAAIAVGIPTASVSQAHPPAAAVAVASSSGTTIPEVPRSSKAGFVAPAVPRSSKQVVAAASAPAPAPAAPIPVPIPVAAAPLASGGATPTVRAVTPSTVSTRLSVGTVHAPAPAAAR